MNASFPTGSNLYKQWLAEKEEIKKFKKKYELKSGKTISFDKARLLWSREK